MGDEGTLQFSDMQREFRQLLVYLCSELQLTFIFQSSPYIFYDLLWDFEPLMNC